MAVFVRFFQGAAKALSMGPELPRRRRARGSVSPWLALGFPLRAVAKLRGRALHKRPRLLPLDEPERWRLTIFLLGTTHLPRHEKIQKRTAVPRCYRQRRRFLFGVSQKLRPCDTKKTHPIRYVNKKNEITKKKCPARK